MSSPPGPSGVAAAVASFERRAMGSPLRLTVVGIPEGRAGAGWEAVSAAIEEIEQALSRFRPTSDLTALNAHAGNPAGVAVGPWLGAALAAADRAHRVTSGAFDPRVLGDLERLGYAGAPIPAPVSTEGDGSAETVARAANNPADRRPGVFADGRWLHLDPRTRQAAVAAPIDLGGIGKGLAIRWAMAVLERSLPELSGPGGGALLEAGGDIVARGAAPQEGPWMVGIEDPGGGAEVAVAALDEGAISTSSIAVHRWRTDAGRDVHHLIDPRNGEPGGEGLLRGDGGRPGPRLGRGLVQDAVPGGVARHRRPRPRPRACRVVGPGGRAVEMTPAARPRTAWLASEA